MKLVGWGYYWQDVEAGTRYRTINRTVTETDLVNFISVTGMLETIFIDATFEVGAIKGRFVPAALSYTLIEGLQCQSLFQGTGLALLEVEKKVLKPVMVGDTIHGEIEILAVKPTSKGNRAVVTSINDVLNQDGDKVLSYKAVRMMAGRP
ncbi:MAG: acyl dehydratase [Burkholderiales bacterium]|nr:acyl dehydratase [Burkholderiales bacterium]